MQAVFMFNVSVKFLDMTKVHSVPYPNLVYATNLEEAIKKVKAYFKSHKVEIEVISVTQNGGATLF